LGNDWVDENGWMKAAEDCAHSKRVRSLCLEQFQSSEQVTRARATLLPNSISSNPLPAVPARLPVLVWSGAILGDQ